MKIYKNDGDYWLIPDVVKEKKKKGGIRYSNGRFAMNYSCYLPSAEEVPIHELLFDQSKKTNIVFRMHKHMGNIVRNENYTNGNTKTTVLFAVKEFEESFKDILKRFDVEFLAVNGDD